MDTTSEIDSDDCKWLVQADQKRRHLEELVRKLDGWIQHHFGEQPGHFHEEDCRPCATTGCDFQVTWHETHCCGVCDNSTGGRHGPRCDKMPMPEEADTAVFLPLDVDGVCVIEKNSFGLQHQYTSIDGACGRKGGNNVLGKRCLWRVTNFHFKAQTDGLGCRRSKHIDDCFGPSHIVKWGDLIDGVDEGDGWIRCLWKAPRIAAGDGVAVTVAFNSDDESEILLTQGMQGTVHEVDEEGDACIMFDGIVPIVWVYRENFDKLLVEPAREREQVGERTLDVEVSPLVLYPRLSTSGQSSPLSARQRAVSAPAFYGEAPKTSKEERSIYRACLSLVRMALGSQGDDLHPEAEFACESDDDLRRGAELAELAERAMLTSESSRLEVEGAAATDHLPPSAAKLLDSEMAEISELRLQLEKCTNLALERELEMPQISELRLQLEECKKIALERELQMPEMAELRLQLEDCKNLALERELEIAKIAESASQLERELQNLTPERELEMAGIAELRSQLERERENLALERELEIAKMAESAPQLDRELENLTPERELEMAEMAELRSQLERERENLALERELEMAGMAELRTQLERERGNLGLEQKLEMAGMAELRSQLERERENLALERKLEMAGTAELRLQLERERENLALERRAAASDRRLPSTSELTELQSQLARQRENSERHTGVLSELTEARLQLAQERENSERLAGMNENEMGAVCSQVAELQAEVERLRCQTAMAALKQVPPLAVAHGTGGGEGSHSSQVAALLEQLKDVRWELRRDAVMSLSCLCDQDVATQSRAASCIHEVMPAVVQILQTDPAVEVRIAAAVVLGGFGQKGQEAAPELKVVVWGNDASQQVRIWAAVALLQLGCHSGPELHALQQFLEDPDPCVRSSAAQALADLGELGYGERANPLIPSLLRILEEDPEPLLRCDAADALGCLGESAEWAVPSLTKTLQDGLLDVTIRASAAQALGRFGELAASAAPAVLQVILEAGPARIRHKAAEALCNLGEDAGAAALPALQEALLEGDDEGRRYASAALRGLGEQALSAVPVLIQAALSEKNENIARNIVKTLGCMDEETVARAHAALSSRGRGNEDALVARERTAKLLGYLGEPTSPVKQPIGRFAFPASQVAFADGSM